MIILVCGGRNFTDQALLDRVLSMVNIKRGINLLIHGAARGADNMAGKWAKQTGIPVRAYPAEWNRYGTAAGPMRNTKMLDFGKPDAVIAFKGGEGTKNMVRQAKARGVPVWCIKWPKESSTNSDSQS